MKRLRENIISRVKFKYIITIYRITTIGLLISLFSIVAFPNLSVDNKPIYALLMLAVVNLFEIYILFGVDSSKSSYSDNGRHALWYNYTLKLMKTKWIIEAFNKMNEKGLFSTFSNLIFVSPSANKGVYEKVLYNHLKETKSIRFLISDIGKISNHEQSEECGESSYTYVESRDALSISTLLSEFKLSRCNVIWDFKGALWYSMKGKDIANTQELIELLEAYKSCLDEKGILVIDDVRVKFINLRVNINLFFGIKTGFMERSTYSKLRDFIESSATNEVKEYIKSNFNEYRFESDSNKKIAIVAFQKK